MNRVRYFLECKKYWELFLSMGAVSDFYSVKVSSQKYTWVKARFPHLTVLKYLKVKSNLSPWNWLMNSRDRADFLIKMNNFLNALTL